MKNKIISFLIILFMSVSVISLSDMIERRDNAIPSTITQTEVVAATTPQPQTPSSSIKELEVIGNANHVYFNKKFDSISSNSQTYTGLVSYLTINFNPSNVSGISEFKVKRAIGSLTYNIDTDEKGTLIKPNESGVYYFTRQATYIVTYKIGETTYTSQCYFSPEINVDVLQGVGSRKELKNIQYINGKYYILGDGLSTITQTICYNTDLYDLRINNREDFESATDNTYHLSIPANSYGALSLNFSSKFGFLTRTIDIIVINPYYQHSFILYDEKGNETSNDFDDYKFGTDTTYKSDFYVFNSKVTLNLTLNDNLVNTDGATYYKVEKAGEFPTDEEIALAKNKLNAVKTECLKLLNLYSTETIRNTNNTSSTTNERKLIMTPKGPMWTADFNAVDHSIYKISTTLSFSTSTNINTSIVSFKIITKIPVTTNRLDFAIYLTGSNETSNENLNYLSTCLDGYLYDGTVIHTQNANTAFFSTCGTMYYYTINNSSSNTMISNKIDVIEQSATGITPYDIRIQTSGETITNDTMFQNFYTFNFSVKYYNNYSFYYFCLTDYASTLNNSAYISGLTTTPHVKALANESINIGGSVNTLDYDTGCIPVYMRVTYNGNSYENFYNLISGDELTFTDYGNYVLELYTFPTYEFCEYFLAYWKEAISLSKYYTRIEFTIDGPSITVTSKDNSGAPLVVTNNMYTNNDVIFKITLREELNETYELYKNNELYSSNNVSTSSSGLKIPATKDFFGTWKIYVLDANKNVLDTTTFTVVDSSYQGFSINYHQDYEDLKAYKYNSDSMAYEVLDSALSYHLIDEGKYRIKITNGEKIYFYVKHGATASAVRNSATKSITNYINFDIVEPFFAITFESGAPGESITESVSVASVNGIDIQLVQVYKNGKYISEFTPSDMGGIANILGSSTSFSDTGIYTFKLIDKFGNSYEVQIQKYYKANVALILLIIITAFGLAFLVYFIFRSKRGLKVK